MPTSPLLHAAPAGASFSEDGSLLLLVCTGGWALLQAAGWDGQAVPAYSRVLHFAPQQGGRGSARGEAGAAGATGLAAATAAGAAGAMGAAGGEECGVVELAGGAILSGAMAADRTRGDHYYAGK